MSGSNDYIRSNIANMIIHLLLNGASESALGVGVDIIESAKRLLSSRARQAPDGQKVLEQQVWSLDGQSVLSGAGRRLFVDGQAQAELLSASDVIVIPGWFAASAEEIGALLEQKETQQAIEFLQQASQRGCLIAASCSGTFLLAQSGLLHQQSATTAWWLAGAFSQRYPQVQLDAERMVIEAKGVLTAGSAFAHADLVLAVVARLFSPTLANWVTRYLVLDQRSSQAQYMVLEHMRVTDAALQKAERFIRKNLHRQFSLNELAAAAALSPRTLSRRIHAALGMTPNEWIQRLRVAHANHLLRSSQQSVEKVAEQVGYADPAAFRRIFKRFSGNAPSASRPNLTQH